MESKAELLTKMESAYHDWESVLGQVGESRMEEPGVAGDWSVKDLVAHTSTWQKSMLARLRETFYGEQHVPSEVDGLGIEERNQIYYRQNHNRPLAEVLAEAPGVYWQIVDTVQALSWGQLSTVPPEGSPLKAAPWEYIAGDTYEHYEEHGASIREWLASLSSVA